MNDLIWTGYSWWGQRIYIEATKDPETNAALKSTFKDYFRKTAPLYFSREDVQICLKLIQGDKKEQLGLFDDKTK